MKKIICLFLGHYTGSWRDTGISVEGFGGFISSNRNSKGLRKYCLRCLTLMPAGFSRTIKK